MTLKMKKPYHSKSMKYFLFFTAINVSGKKILNLLKFIKYQKYIMPQYPNFFFLIFILYNGIGY